MSRHSPALSLLLSLLLAVVLAPVAHAAGSSKVACDYSNRLCQWNGSFVFGAVVSDEKVFVNGGLLANEADTPSSGSAFQVLDLRSMSPYIMQVEADSTLHTSRYRHQLVMWKNRILAVGGQADDAIGISQQILNVIALDLDTRKWEMLKQFRQPGGPVETIFDAAVVAGDNLLIAFQNLNPENAGRQYLTLDLNTKEVGWNYNIFAGVLFLDFPLVGIMSLTRSGKYPHLVVQAKRQLPDATNIMWSEVVGPDGGELAPNEKGEMEPSGWFGPLNTTVIAPSGMQQLPGGDGGRSLALNILQVGNKNKLALWTRTSASFTKPIGRQVVNLVSMYDIDVSGVKKSTAKSKVSLALDQLFMTLPLGVDLAGLQSVDLPLLGMMKVPPAAVTVLPYVGDVDLISDLDSSNVNIQSSGEGLVIRGSGLADVECEPGALWQPFVIHISMSGAAPSVRAVSNNTWCETRDEQKAAASTVNDAAILGTGTQLYSVGSGSDKALMVLSSVAQTNPGGQLLYVPQATGVMRGAYISVGNSTVQSFNISLKGADYVFPIGVSSCMTALGGRSVYVEHGGYYMEEEVPEKASATVFSMAAEPGQSHKLQPVSGTSGAPATARGSMACTPEAKVYMFGGLKVTRYDDGFPPKATWAPTNSLHSFQLQGSSSKPSASRVTELKAKKGSEAPGPRSGHALLHLPASTVSKLGMSQGALLLYGGSSVNSTDLSTIQSVTDMQDLFNGTTWDRSTWLFDIADGSWTELQTTVDAPPGLMYHSMAVQGEQVMLWGGLAFHSSNNSLTLSTELFVLDFSEAQPRWRKAAVDNINGQGAAVLDYPNTGIVPLPELGAVALKHRSGVSVAPIPQSLLVDYGNQGNQGLQSWGRNTLNLTAGDWIRLRAPRSGVTLQQPLFIGGDVLLSGVDTGAQGRHLLQQPRGSGVVRNLAVRCGQNASSAIVIRSPGALLENLVISGCNGSAINIGVDATGAYSSPATLRNIKLAANTGRQGSAIWIGPAASAVLENCSIDGNTASDSIVYAGPGSGLKVTGSSVTNSNSTAIAFEGQELLVQQSRFANNRANSTAGKLGNGGALRVTYPDAGTHGLFSNITVNGSTFVNCSAKYLGGAIYLGRYTTTHMSHSSFSGSSADEGGAVLADRDSCLQNMTQANFTRNTAAKRGGAVLMRNPSCRSIIWNAAWFVDNLAGGDGGALYLTEASNRQIKGSSSHYINNTASGTVSNGGDGGALYLGLWASSVQLTGSNFTNNTANNRGGAINALVIESSITLINSTADNNHAGDVHEAAANPGNAQLLRRSVLSEGGALAVQGSEAHVNLSRVELLDNTAGRGGAVSINSDRGNLSTTFSSFRRNTAWTAGGGLSVTDKKHVSITNSTFEENTLLWPELAAGGGFYCFLCYTVAVEGSTFQRNRAAYGGGAAVLQPHHASRITDTWFEANEAYPELQAPKAGRVVLAENPFLGPPAVFPGNKTKLQNSALAILGPVGSNTTGDTGFYTGGGGLYLTITSTVRLAGSSFLGNKAFNGGGLLARTDACKDPQHLDCSLTLTDLSVQGNSASAGGGLLVTNINSSIVQLEDCPAGTALTAATARTCLQDNTNSILKRARGGNGRGLLATDSPAQANTAATGALLLTSAAKMHCSSMQDMTGRITVIQENCDDPIRTAPGVQISPQFTLINSLGEQVQGDIYDASMPMRAELLDGTTSELLANYTMLGNATQASNGVATFAGLKINGSPFEDQGRYKLRFSSANGLQRVRDLQFRHCQAGEATAKTNEYSLGYECRVCTNPDYSFFPDAPQCSQCALLPMAAAAVCNGPVVVPARGFYQAHPRNPVLRKCIATSACNRSPQNITDMSDWALLHANMNTTQLNEVNNSTGLPYYYGYMKYMCAEGYQGPLCGSCTNTSQARFGHSAHLCVKCLSKPINSFLYFLVCCAVLLIPCMQMLMHSKNVDKRTQQLANASKNLASATSAAFTSQATLDTVRSSEQQQAQQQQQLGSRASVRQEQLPLGSSPGNVQLVNIVNGSHPLQGSPAKPAKAVTMSAGGGDVGGSPLDQYGPATSMPIQHQSSLSPFAVTQGLGQAGDATGKATAVAAPAAGPFVVKQPGAGNRLFERLFGVSSLDEDDVDIWNTNKVSATTVSGSNLSGRLSTVPTLTAGGPVGLQSAGTITGPGRIHRRTFKFWHTDVLTMMVSYMQLLGLLRLIRIDWPEALQQWLIYLDLTSGATTWISLECSLDDSQHVPRSIKRTIFLLLWPAIGLGALSVYWLVYAALYRMAEAHPVRRTQHIKQYMLPHMVMSSVILLYFLYTPTSREVISLFSCQPADTAQDLINVQAQPPQVPEATWLSNGTHLTGGAISPQAEAVLVPPSSSPYSWPSKAFWTSDTAVQCGTPVHLGVALGLGIPGLIFFVVGLPVGLWLMLKRFAGKQTREGRMLEHPQVELQYGLMYDKYRYRCYYWECVVLLENCALTMLLVMLQSYAAQLQVLVAMVVIFIEAVLHITFQPYGCNMLDTLRRISVFGLFTTLFLIMLASLEGFAHQDRLRTACVVLIAVVNLAVLGVHIWACCLELHRWLLMVLDREKRGYLTWGDVRWFLTNQIFICGKMRRQQQAAGAAGAAGAQGGAAAAAGQQRGPPQESVVGTVTVVNQPAGGTHQRTGNVVVVHTSPDAINNV